MDGDGGGPQEGRFDAWTYGHSHVEFLLLHPMKKELLLSFPRSGLFCHFQAFGARVLKASLDPAHTFPLLETRLVPPTRGHA